MHEARAWIAGLEREERERTGIRGLKVGYNRVFGYYIEISAAALAAAEKEHAARNDGSTVLPAEYQPRQTLANATRYVTARLKECEARLLGAQETLEQMEADVYRRLVAEVAGRSAQLLSAAAAVAYIDVVSTLAEVASDSQLLPAHRGRLDGHRDRRRPAPDAGIAAASRGSSFPTTLT